MLIRRCLVLPVLRVLLVLRVCRGRWVSRVRPGLPVLLVLRVRRAAVARPVLPVLMELMVLTPRSLARLVRLVRQGRRDLVSSIRGKPPGLRFRRLLIRFRVMPTR